MTPDDVNKIVDEKLKVLLGAYVVSDNKLTLKKSLEVVPPNTISPVQTMEVYGGVTDNVMVPDGWTRSASGHVITYTHNFGHTDYVVVAALENNNISPTVAVAVGVENKTSTSFDIVRRRTSDGAAVGGRNDWICLVQTDYITSP